MSKITASANGEDCQVRLPGVCTHDPAKTIWSHARHGAAGKGKGIKAIDEAGAYACTACDAAYDQLIGVPQSTAPTFLITHAGCGISRTKSFACTKSTGSSIATASPFGKNRLRFECGRWSRA